MIRDLLLRAYLLGYGGYLPSRLVRRLVAGTELHRAWLCGYMGIFRNDDGRLSSVCDRPGLHSRARNPLLIAH